MVTCGKCGRVATGTRLEAQWRREARPRKFRYACMACGDGDECVAAVHRRFR